MGGVTPSFSRTLSTHAQPHASTHTPNTNPQHTHTPNEEDDASFHHQNPSSLSRPCSSSLCLQRRLRPARALCFRSSTSRSWERSTFKTSRPFTGKSSAASSPRMRCPSAPTRSRRPASRRVSSPASTASPGTPSSKDDEEAERARGRVAHARTHARTHARMRRERQKKGEGGREETHAP